MIALKQEGGLRSPGLAALLACNLKPVNQIYRKDSEKWKLNQKELSLIQKKSFDRKNV